MRHSPSLGEPEAWIAIDICFAELRKRAKASALAVADGHGKMLAFSRTDGCTLPLIAIAQNKAYTSARVRKLSGEVGRSAQRDGSDVHYHVAPAMLAGLAARS